MQDKSLIKCLIAIVAAMGTVSCTSRAPDGSQTKSKMDDSGWTRSFSVDKGHFASVGRNPYFILEPGHQMIYEGEEDGKPHRLVITVLKETKMVNGVETRIIEERETVGGQMEEISRNYFAIDKRNNDIYYFGEDVDMYKNGKVTSHGGSWLSGVNGAHFGLAMPGNPAVGQKFYQEVAPDSAMDRVEIVSVTKTKKVPAGEFTHCVRTEETSPLEPNTKEYKLYAPGVGLVADGDLNLVHYDGARE